MGGINRVMDNVNQRFNRQDDAINQFKANTEKNLQVLQQKC